MYNMIVFILNDIDIHITHSLLCIDVIKEHISETLTTS